MQQKIWTTVGVVAAKITTNGNSNKNYTIKSCKTIKLHATFPTVG